MDWFKLFKRKGTPMRFYVNSGGESLTWLFIYDGYWPFGHRPDMQVQIFTEGIQSQNKSIQVDPYKCRITILVAPSRIGVNLPSNIYVGKEAFDLDNKWKAFPKEEINLFLNKHYTEICSCFIRGIFENK